MGRLLSGVPLQAELALHLLAAHLGETRGRRETAKRGAGREGKIGLGNEGGGGWGGREGGRGVYWWEGAPTGGGRSGVLAMSGALSRGTWVKLIWVRGVGLERGQGKGVQANE